MTQPVDLAERAARVLVRGSREGSRPMPPLDPATIEVVAAAIRGRRRRVRLQWTAGGAAAAAAALLFFVAARQGSRERGEVARPAPIPPPVVARAPGVVDAVAGDVRIVRAEGALAAGRSSPIEVGDEIVAPPSGHLDLTLPTGTRIAVEEGADFTVVASAPIQLFQLRGGSIRAEVQKLVAGERFVVRTPDAEVEVRGTSFRLGIAVGGDTCRAGSLTRLSVYEGAVAVRAEGREVVVGAGDAWPPGCATYFKPAAAPEDETATLHASAARPLPSARPAERSSLAEQNDLYARAVALRESDPLRATLLFEQLVARYPSSPLAETALAERMRLLASAHRGEAVAAARDYLARYPGGAARKDAERIVAHDLR